MNRADLTVFKSTPVAADGTASHVLAHDPIERRANSWRHSLLGKFTLVCLTGVILSYSIGILVGWVMMTTAANEQWTNQAQTNVQIASATLRNIYTYASVIADDNGQVSKIITDRPIGDDESILFTGFSPIDVVALISNQTKNDAWIFRYDSGSDSFETIAATVETAIPGPPIKAKTEPLFNTGKELRAGTGFVVINGVSHYIGLLPIITPAGKVIGAVATSIGRQVSLYRAQNEMLYNALITAMTVLALTGAAVTITAKRLFKPVPALIDAVLRIANEKTDAITPFQERADEIGDLAVAIESLREVVEERGRLREIRDMAVELEYLAHHDPLTGLPNRALMMKTLDASVAELGTEDTLFNVLMLDLDRFKAVNDTLGHSIGDELLVATAGRIMAVLGPGDVAARLGGDEFAVIQRVAHYAELEASKLAARLIEAISAGFSSGGRDLAIGTSIGIACAPQHGAASTSLLRNADLALYRAKASGRSTYRFFELGMEMEAKKQHALDLDLRKALQRNEFALHFQPIAALGSRAITGFEALIRWYHPQLGLVEPSRFIPLAEETGLIIPIGEWVLRRACEEAAKWPEPMMVAVNMSPVQMRHAGVVQAVVSALQASGLPASRLELEITETAMLAGDASIEALHALRDMGISIALDDFGTGYASLSYLAGFPYHKIKIDRSFVANLSTRPDCRCIVAAIVNLAHGLGMETTAEGVETEDQLVILRAIGCTNVQGYYLGRPKPPSEIVFEAAGFGSSHQPETGLVSYGR